MVYPLLTTAAKILSPIGAAALLDLRSSTKKKTPKLKFPKMDVGKPISKVYAKGSGTRKVNE